MKIYPHLDNRKDKTGHHALKILIRKDGERKQFNTGYKIRKSHWDQKRLKVKIHQDADTINSTLKNLINGAVQFSAEQPQATAGDILHFIRTGKVSNETTLKDYSEQYVKNYKNASTIKSIKAAAGAMYRFKPGVRLTDIDRKFINQFVTQSRRSKTDKTLHNYLTIVQKILDYAIMDSILLTNPLKGYRKPTPKTTRLREWLTFDEQKKIVNASFKDHQLQIAKDVFVFQMLIDGIRISNALTMQRKFLKVIDGEPVLSFYEVKNERQKKHKTVYVSDLIQTIIDRWQTPNRFIFPLLPDNYNSLSEEKKTSKRSYARQKINSGLILVMEELEIDKHITTHSARHTAAHTASELGVSVYEIMHMLNHGNLEMTNNYMKGFRKHNNKKLIQQIEEKLKQTKN